jgi:hypothetical protein
MLKDIEEIDHASLRGALWTLRRSNDVYGR